MTAVAEGLRPNANLVAKKDKAQASAWDFLRGVASEVTKVLEVVNHRPFDSRIKRETLTMDNRVILKVHREHK